MNMLEQLKSEYYDDFLMKGWGSVAENGVDENGVDTFTMQLSAGNVVLTAEQLRACHDVATYIWSKELFEAFFNCSYYMDDEELKTITLRNKDIFWEAIWAMFMQILIVM